MSFSKKIFLFLIIVVALSFGIYYFLIPSNSKTYILGNNATTQQFFEKANNLFQSKKNSPDLSKVSSALPSSNSFFKNTENFIIETVNNIKEESDNAIGNVSDNAKNAAFGIIEKNINGATQSLREKLGFIGAQTKQNFVVGYSVKPGQIIYFFIVKPENLDNADYEIDWGDGKNEQSNFGDNNIRLVSHVWYKEGEYDINFKMKTLSGDLDYSNIIMVKK